MLWASKRTRLNVEHEEWTQRYGHDVMIEVEREGRQLMECEGSERCSNQIAKYNRSTFMVFDFVFLCLWLSL